METQTDSVDLVDDEVAANVARAALFAALVGAFAYVSFPNPISPAPITLQVLGVFLAGIMLGPVWGAASLVLYLAAGALGAPVFSAGTGGLGVLLGGPTLGYLWSYPIAAAVVGYLTHRGTGLRGTHLRGADHRGTDLRGADLRGADLRELEDLGVPTLVGAMIAGTAVIYAFGIVGMMVVLGLGPVEAFLVGAAAFLPAEGLKIAAAVGIVRSDAIAAA